VTAHYQSLRILGLKENQIKQLTGDHRGAGLPEADEALLDFALKLGRFPASLGQEDIAELSAFGFTDEGILEAVLMTALTNFLCCLSTGLGVTSDFPPLVLGEDPGFKGPASHKGSGVVNLQGSGPYLSSVEMSAADFPPFAFFQEKFGFIPNIFRAQTLRPDVLEAEAKAVGTILLTEDVLSRFQKECILLVVSALNLNTYCVAVHSEMLRNLGIPAEKSDQIALDHHVTDLSQTDKALLDCAVKLAQRPAEFGADDIQILKHAGLTDEQILEAVVMTALTHFLNTLQMGLGTIPDFEPRLIFPVKEVNLSASSSRPTIDLFQKEESAPEDPDVEIVARVRAGDTDAFEHLVRVHGRKIYRSLVGILGTPEEAEDALQDTFIKAFTHISEFEGRSRFSTWLVRIAINTGVQRLRGRKDLDSLEGEDDEFKPRNIQAWGDDPEQAYSKEEVRRLIEQEIMKLPVKYRVVLVLRDIEELSTVEAANALGLGVPALKARLIRGRLMLRESLVPYFAQGTTGAIA
jgi:RNA polymerase sigma-70 factor (ECF subfamily)